MFYSEAFFKWLIWLCLAGLIIDFVFILWYHITDFKQKALW